MEGDGDLRAFVVGTQGFGEDFRNFLHGFAAGLHRRREVVVDAAIGHHERFEAGVGVVTAGVEAVDDDLVARAEQVSALGPAEVAGERCRAVDRLGLGFLEFFLPRVEAHGRFRAQGASGQRAAGGDEEAGERLGQGRR